MELKMDLITLYGKMGLPCIEMSDDELEEELTEQEETKETYEQLSFHLG